MAGLRPVVLTAETLDFYRGFERNPRWECKLSSAQLHERGKQPSHFCLEGWQSKRGEQIHAGVLHVPDEDLRILAAQASRVQTYLHEIKSSPAHPAFFDVDMAVSPFNDLFWKMIVAVIERAELNHEEIACATMQEYLKMPSLHPETSTLPYGILERLRASKPFVPNATGDEKWTWLDVARCGLDATEPSGVFGDATHPNVIRPLVCVFLMAISKLIQRVCLSFYPDIAKTDTDTKMQTFVLTNYEAETHSINFPENDKRETKLGAHVYLRQLYVDTHTQLYIWQALVDLFTGSFAEVPCADGPHAFWTSVFDAAPYTSKVGGLRMPFALKAAPCKKCGTAKKRKQCDWCCGAGKISSPRYYGPLCRIKPGNGDVDVTEKGLSSLFNRVYLSHMATVRVSAGTQVTPGVNLEGKTVPSNLHMVQKGEIEARLGKARAAATIRRLSDRTGVAGDSAEMHQVLATVNAEDTMHDHLCQKAPTMSVRMPLTASDARFIALQKAFPALLSELFHECYLSVIVSGASIIHHSSNGEPKLINVFVKGEGASRCFNRTVDPSDIAGVPGCHTNWQNTVFFTIYRDDHGKIVQRCFNKQLKCNRRSSRSSQSGKPCACGDWAGEARMVSRKHAQFIRDFFYTPEEQREENCRREVVAQAKALARRHSKRMVAELGPTSEYTKYVEKVCKRARTKSQEPISVADLDERDVGMRSQSYGTSGAAFNFYL